MDLSKPRIAWIDPLRCVSTAQFCHAVLLPEGWNALCGVDGYVLGSSQEAPQYRRCKVCVSAVERALLEAMEEWSQPPLPFTGGGR